MLQMSHSSHSPAQPTCYGFTYEPTAMRKVKCPSFTSVPKHGTISLPLQMPISLFVDNESFVLMRLYHVL